MGLKSAEVAEQVESAIMAGRLAPGTRLPTHRELDIQHGVALNTATRAMRLLVSRGLVVGEIGRGSYVRSPAHVDAAAFTLDPTEPSGIDLARNVMPLPGLAEWFEAAVRIVLRRERASLIDYPPHAGRMVDRAAAAQWMARDGHLPNDPGRVLICAGAQHAIIVALKATTRPGDILAVESLTWPGIQAIASELGLQLLPLPMDDHGLRPRSLLRLAARHSIAALYCMPTLQNPVAASMPVARREAVATLARRFDFQVIEDDPYGFLMEPRAAPLAALAPERSWYVRSLSKSLAPGLRTAWLLAPHGQEQRAASIIRATIWGTPPLGPAVASHWIADGTAAALESKRRSEAKARQAIARGIIPPGHVVHWSSAMHLWVRLPRKLRAESLARTAGSVGVWVTPASAFGVNSSPNAVRLSLCAPPSRADLALGLRRLIDLW